jgi:BirA family biotin operon repressor/biotin-[acetyl-CoA-carboxylase] ligase
VGIPADFRHIAKEETGSTNADCLELARLGDPGNLWITAERQSAGRGRSGRGWTSEGGNLYASVLLVDPAPAAGLANLAFVCALAAADAISRAGAFYGVDPVVSLKWPNDVMIAGSKVAGILLESAALPKARAVVAGFGINCTSHPDDTRYPATHLAAHGIGILPRDLFSELADCFGKRLAQWDRLFRNPGRLAGARRRNRIADRRPIARPRVAGNICGH